MWRSPDVLWACGQIVEFIAVLLRANSEGARHELVKSGAIQIVLKLFFEYVHQSFGSCRYLVMQVWFDPAAWVWGVLDGTLELHEQSRFSRLIGFVCCGGAVTRSTICCTIMWRVSSLRAWRATVKN